ncbi:MULTISPECIES: sigma-70 family RNA polymerase sigma factor [Clostridia]|uniref:sigma-70 family RNA polymerase sigma factor n=1 Tax=Clostridia TaxID=186801 RepID=UPI001A9A9A23|nr:MULTISPECIES: sigma-70 family RNA polymerase sigma factor [Clostridia]
MKGKLNTELIYDREDKKHINSMINDMSESIEWMKTGRQPGLYRGVDKKNAYRKKQYDEIEIIPDIIEQIEREPLYMDQAQRQALIRLFKTFSDRERQCYIMYEAEQLSMQQIADRLGIKKRTVQQYIERARVKVKKIAS